MPSHIRKFYNAPYIDAITFSIEPYKFKPYEIAIDSTKIQKCNEHQFMPMSSLSIDAISNIKHEFVFSLCNHILKHGNVRIIYMMKTNKMQMSEGIVAWPVDYNCLEELFIMADLKSIWK